MADYYRARIPYESCALARHWTRRHDAGADHRGAGPGDMRRNGVPDELDALAGQLTECLAGLGSALIAFSGGVDSSLVAALAARALGEQALAVTAVSPALRPASWTAPGRWPGP